jgi:hypothetical protein
MGSNLNTVIAIVAGVPAVAFGLWMISWQERKTDDAWKRAAEKLGGEFQAKGSKNGGRLIRARRAQTSVVVDVFRPPPDWDDIILSDRKTTQSFTRLVAPAAHAGDLAIHLTLRGMLSKLARLAGSQDLQTGDAAFDKMFVVKTKDEARARAWLDDDMRKRLLALADHSDPVLALGMRLGSKLFCTMDLAEGEVTTRFSTVVSSVDLLVETADVTAAFASRNA